MSKLMAIAISAALILNILSGSVNVLAQELQNENKAITAIESEVIESNKATVAKFDLVEADVLNAYNQVFKIDRSNIHSITNNGGRYASSFIENAIDGNMNTHWETGKPNNAEFKNEIIVSFKDTKQLNRIVYAARQSSAKGKGFAQEFEIHSSTTDEGEFQLVSSGEYKGSTGDLVEIQFAPTKFKRLKFVFTKANQDWASAAEFSFYKEDLVKDQMKKLFTDSTFSAVSEEFNTLEKLEALEESAKAHPLYVQFKEDIANAKQLINEDKLETTIAETKPFNHYSNEDYSKLFRMDYENIKSIRNNGGHYSNAVIGNAVDSNLKTYWETNKTNTNDFTNEIEVEFKEAVKLNRVIYGARESDRKGFAEEFEVYASKTSKGDTYELVTTGKHNMIAGVVEAKFEPTEFKRVKFKFKKSNQNWATISELAFYKEDNLEDKINNLFTNGLMNELKSEFASMSVINQLEEEVANHPLMEQLQVNLNIAKDILNNVNVANEEIVTATQRGNSSTEAKVHQIARTSFSLETFGRYVVPGETIQVFVDADEKGVMPNLVLGQIADDKNGWHRRYSLHPGLNTITAPSYENMKPAVIYVENAALPSEQAYAPKVRLIGGTAFPVYYHGKTDPAEFERELEEYVAKISTNDNDFATGKPKDVVYNVTELISENNTISTSAAGALKGIQELEGTGKTVSDTMDEWEIMWKEFQKISGYTENEQSFNAKFTSRVFTKGPYGWSDWGYTGYNGGNSPRRDGGFFKQIVKPFSVPGNDGWAYYHEWGHNINNSAMEHTEVTNNIYSVIMRKIFNNSTDDRVDWNSLYKRFAGEKVNHGYWTYLGVLEQVQYYYGEDSYGKAARISRTNPDGVMNGLGSNLQRLVVGLSLATETDLTAFFEEWGYVTATDKMKEKVAHLPKPDVKLEYMHSLGRSYEGAGFSKDTKVEITSIKADTENREIILSYNIDEANKEASMGYEILRDGAVVGYTTSTSFVDRNAAPEINYSYEIVAYDKELNAAKPVKINAFTPLLSVENHVTLKLHSEFDPMDYVKASSYKGEDITQDVTIKSNTVDVTKKGNYAVVYEITNADAVETKTTNVTVTSDYTYISDMDAKSANIAWGGLKKDKAPAGGTITLVRQGLEATYAKGIGAHANSEIVYDIEGEGFDFFESYIGIDQAMKGKASSATFEVWVDGEKKFESKVVNSNTDHEFVKVPVTGAKEVKLVTTDAKNNGNTADHTVWADAKLVENSSSPTLTIPKSVSTKVGEPININGQYSAMDAEDGDLTSKVQVIGADKVSFNRVGKYELTYVVTDSDGNETQKTRTISVVNMEDYKYLSNFDWKFTQNSYTAPLKDISISAKTLRLTDESNKEVAYEKGIGAHSNSTIVYDLTDKNSDYFTSFVGVDRQMYGTVGSVNFEVYVDGEKKFESGLMNSIDPQKFIEIDINGAKELKLVVTDGGNGNGSDHATWGDAKLHYANSERVYTKELETAIEAAKALNTEGYSEETVQAFQSSLLKAEEILANKEATQTAVDQVLEELKQAIENLHSNDLNQVITIKDKSLERSIKETLGLTGSVTLGDMHNLSSLTNRTGAVTTLEGLEHAINLVTLNIAGNKVTDFSPLKGLSALENLVANPQIIAVGEVSGPVVEIENIVKHVNGSKVIPKEVRLKQANTGKVIEVDVNELTQNVDMFTIDLTNEGNGVYILTMKFDVNGNEIQLGYMVNNK